MQSVADPDGGKIALMNSPRHIHLRLHSEYSVTDGIVRVGDAIKRAAGDGMPALALTDLGNLFGLVKFYTGARGKGVKPIAGADVWIANPESPDDPCRLLLLVRNRDGYRQLCELLTRAYLAEGRRDRAEIRREWFGEVGSDGLDEAFAVVMHQRKQRIQSRASPHPIHGGIAPRRGMHGLEGVPQSGNASLMLNDRACSRFNCVHSQPPPAWRQCIFQV